MPDDPKTELPVPEPRLIEHDGLAEDGAELIERLRGAGRSSCRACGRELCLHELLASMALGASQAPRCLECLAAALEQSLPDLVVHLGDYFERRECYGAAARWASATEESHGRARCCALATAFVSGPEDG
jgi:hypothetical protein